MIPYKQKRKREVPHIQLVSLIDVLIVVILFLVVTTVFKRKEPKINIQLPGAVQAGVLKEPDILVTISEDNKIFIGDKEIAQDRLVTVLKEEVSKKPDISLAVKAAKTADVEILVRVFDDANRAGIKKASDLIVERKETIK